MSGHRLVVFFNILSLSNIKIYIINKIIITEDNSEKL